MAPALGLAVGMNVEIKNAKVKYDDCKDVSLIDFYLSGKFIFEINSSLQLDTFTIGFRVEKNDKKADC